MTPGRPPSGAAAQGQGGPSDREAKARQARQVMRDGAGVPNAAPMSPAERRALLVSAAVLMHEALRLLDQAEFSSAGAWLSHAAQCLDDQLNSPE